MYICQVCGKEWKDAEAEENEFLCTRKCGGALATVADQASGKGLPVFLAFAVREFQDEPHPTARLWSICDLAELLLRLIVAIKSSELRKAGRLDDAVAKELSGRIEAPTLGKWRGMAEALFKVKVEAEFSPELRPLLMDRILPLLDGAGKARATEETSLAKLRNLLAHGGGITAAAAERLLKAWVPRIRELIGALAFFSAYDLVAVQGGQGWTLTGTEGKALWANPAAAAMEDGLHWFNGSETLSLAPLAAFGKPLTVDPEFLVTGESAQIYTRRGETSLEYLPIGSDEVSSSLSTQAELDHFLDLFRLRRPATGGDSVSSFQVPGFEMDILKEADHHIGREGELEQLEAALAERRLPVLWISGTAGIGKSFFISAFTTRLWERQAEALVLPYRFKSGDKRCLRGSFIQFALERLRQAFPEAEQSDGDDKPSKELKPEEALRILMGRLSGKPVVFVLDGLDEIVEKDPRFVQDVVFGMSSEGLTFICSGRSERGLERTFTPETSVVVFPEGLPPMRENDIRAMILQRIGPLRKRLVRQDQEQGEQMVNPFIAKITRAAEGVPLYVRYVIEDILNNKYLSFDAGEKLPPTLAAYHEELLRRCSIGTLQKILTPLVCLLAVAKQALATDELIRFFIETGVIEDTPPWRDTVQKGLRAVGSMLRRVESPDGSAGFSLYHHSLRQHILASERSRDECSLLRRRLCDLSVKPHDHELSPYLYRWAITHLAEEGRSAEALTLAQSFPFWMERLQRTPRPSETEAALQDWKLLRPLIPKDHVAAQAEGARNDGALRLWEAFFRSNAHILRRGNEEWPGYKILLQLAVEHADDNPVTMGAERWLEEGKCDWRWLKSNHRPEHMSNDAAILTIENAALTIDPFDAGFSMNVFEDHEGRLVAWSQHSICVFESDYGERLMAKTNQESTFLRVVKGNNGLLVSWSDDLIRIWDIEKGECRTRIDVRAIIPGHLASRILISVNQNGTIAVWSNERVYLWNCETGEYLGEELSYEEESGIYLDRELVLGGNEPKWIPHRMGVDLLFDSVGFDGIEGIEVNVKTTTSRPTAAAWRW